MKCFYTYLWRCFKDFFLFFSLLLVHFPIIAQDNELPALRGMVANADQNPVPGSTVCLLRADSSIVKFQICNTDGLFRFDNLIEGKYLLKITSLGFKTAWYGPFNVSRKSKVLSVGKLQISQTSTGLNEVTIVEKKEFIEIMPGKVVLNVENSILSAGNSAFDILKTAPGVQMDAEDNIRLNGNPKVLIVINGKQSFMQGPALMDMLKSLQSQEIGQIELISNPSSKFDAAGSGSIINIKIKKNKLFGANGSISGGSGLSLVNPDQEPNLKLNSGVNLNFKNRLVSAFANYTYGDGSQDRFLVLERDIDNDMRTAINVDYQSLTRRLAHTYRGGLDFNVNPHHVIGFMLSGSDNQVHIGKTNSSSIVNRGVLDSIIRTQSDQDRGLNNLVFNVNYKGRVGKKAGEISFDWDYISYHRSSMELLTNRFLDGNNNPYRQSLLLKNSSPSEYDIQSIKLDYNVSLGKSSSLELGIQRSEVKGDSRLDFGSMVSSSYYPDNKFVSHFLIDEQIGAGYVNYQVDFKRSSLALGLRAESTLSEGQSLTSGESNKRNYLNFFPNLQFSHELNKTSKLLFSYSRRITRPGYDNLNPFVAYLDQYSYRSGNPLLKPEFIQIFEATHLYKNRFSATLRAKKIDDLMLEINEQDDVTHVNTMISRNIEKQYMYGVELSAPFTIASWWDISVNLQSMYEKYVTQAADGPYENRSPSFTFNALQSLKLRDKFSAEINTKYESPTIYGIYNYQAAYSVDVAFAKSLFKNNGSVRLRVSDLFNTATNRYSSTYENLNMRSLESRDSMVGQLSFTYLFGRRTVKGARKRDTGSESERGRIGS